MKKYKNQFVYSLILITILTIGLAVYGYFANNFEGKVISKEVGGCLDICFSDPPEYLLVSYWQGEKQFTTDDKSYKGIQIGKTYSFKKNFGSDLIILK